MIPLDASIAQRLKDAAGEKGWSEDAEAIAPFVREFRGRWRGKTPLLLTPDTTASVSRILSICNETGTQVVPQGGNTGLVGGQIPHKGEVLLSLHRMTRIREVSAEENILIAEAGVILASAQEAATKAGRLFPLSLAAQGSCTIGGNISTNAGGVNVLRYGMTRDLVLGLEAVLADGSVLDLMRGLRKDNTGYDLKQLFIGAEGTLGIVTAAMLKLYPKPSGYSTALFAIKNPDIAVGLLNRLQDATGGQVTAFELMEGRALDLVVKHIPGASVPLASRPNWSVLIEVSNPSAFDATEALLTTLGEAMEQGIVSDAVLAKSEKERGALWRLRETIPEAQRLDGASIPNDISIPLSKIAEFIASADAAVRKALPSARTFSFGHIGDGNIHFAIQAPGDDTALNAARGKLEGIVQDEAARRNGSISAEHGLGIAKNEAAARYKSETEIAVMRALKKALDPKNILNPGKLLP